MRDQNCVPSKGTKKLLHREHGAMFARFGTVSDFTAGTLERRRENLADALPPLQLQPRIFSHQISSIGAVARSPQELTPSEGPALRLQRAAIARRSPPAVAHHRDLDATVSGVTTTAPASGDVRFRGKTGSRGLSVKPTRLTHNGSRSATNVTLPQRSLKGPAWVPRIVDANL